MHPEISYSINPSLSTHQNQGHFTQGNTFCNKT